MFYKEKGKRTLQRKIIVHRNCNNKLFVKSSFSLSGGSCLQKCRKQLGVEAKRYLVKKSTNLAKFLILLGGITTNIFLSSLKIQCCKIQIVISIIYSSRILGLSSCLSSCHIPVIFLSSCHSCGRGTLSYSLCFRNQADQGDEREGFEREGYRWSDRRWRDWRGRV